MPDLDRRLNTRVSSEHMRIIDQESRRLGLEQSEWTRMAIVHFAVACRLLDIADVKGMVDLRDPATLARLLGE